MADAYWKYVESRNKPAALPPHSVKRPRTDYETPTAHDIPDYFGHEDDRAGGRVIRDTDSINASYDRYLRTAQVPSFGSDSGRSMSNGLDAHHLVDDPRRMAIGGSDLSRPIGISLPADASSTLYVECLPANCSRREVSHIFRPFLGYKEVRLVTKEPRHSGGDPLVLCFVDFLSPAHAATAMDALQGYKFDEHDRDSANLRLQFARFPGARSGAGQRGKR